MGGYIAEKLLINWSFVTGVSHVDELLYLFPMGEMNVPHIVPSKVDSHLQEMMTEMWINFATNG